MASESFQLLVNSLTGFSIYISPRETKTFVIVGVIDPRNKEQVSIYRYVNLFDFFSQLSSSKVYALYKNKWFVHRIKLSAVPTQNSIE